MNEEYQKELENFKKYPRYKIRLLILFIRLLVLISSDTTLVCISIGTFMLFGYLFGINLLFMHICSFLYFLLYGQKQLREMNMDKDRDEMKRMIKDLKEHLAGSGK